MPRAATGPVAVGAVIDKGRVYVPSVWVVHAVRALRRVQNVRQVLRQLAPQTVLPRARSGGHVDHPPSLRQGPSRAGQAALARLAPTCRFLIAARPADCGNNN